MQTQAQQVEPVPTKFASFNERKEFLGFYDGVNTPLGHALGIYLTPAQMKKSEQPGASARLFNKPGYGGWQITMGAPKKATSPVPAEKPASAPAVAYFAAYTENETTRSQVGTYDSHREAMHQAKEAVKADKKRMPRQEFTPLVIELAPDSPAALAAANVAHEVPAVAAQYHYDKAKTYIDKMLDKLSKQFPNALIYYAFSPQEKTHIIDMQSAAIEKLNTDAWAEVYGDLVDDFESKFVSDSLLFVRKGSLVRLNATKAPTSPAATLPPVSEDKQLGHRIAPSEAAGINKNAQTVVFYLDEKREQFPRTAPHRLLRRLLTLLGVTERAHSVHRPRNYALFCIDATNALALRISEEAAQLDANHGEFTPAHAAAIARRELGRNTNPTSPAVAQEDTTALLVEHQGDEYTRTCNDEEPDELIRARHGEPAPVLTPPEPLRKRKFLFSRLTMAGHRVEVLHQVGKCAVARVFPCEGRAPYYAARWRHHHAQFGHLHEAEQALLTLRRLDNAKIRRDNEVFTLTDALDQLAPHPPCLDRFCTLHNLDVGRSYTRRELCRAITDRRQPKMPVYLSLLNKLTTTNPV